MNTTTPAPAVAHTLELVIAHTELQTPDILTCTLTHPGGADLPSWSAGAHIDIHLPNGLVRQYSLCSDPADRRHYQIAVKREDAGRGGSIALHAAARTGSTLRVGTPRNLFALTEGASHYLLLGGGIGVTPLLAMAHALHAQGASFTLAVFARSQAHLPLPTTWQDLPWAANVRLHFEAGSAQEQLSLPELVGQLQATDRIYMCGPSGFMDAVHQATNLPPAHVHFEHFSAPVAAAPADAGAAGSFEVILAQQGHRRIHVAADQSMADALHAAGVAVDTVCEQGICGSCITRYLDGTPVHLDSCVSGDEQATHVAVCCSRSATPTLTLDL